MARRLAGFVLSSLICGALAGCGLFVFERREAWRDEAEEACLAQKLVQPSPYMEPRPAISGPGACGMSHPFRVSAFADGTVGLTSKAVLACPAISTFDRWLLETVQPAAALYFGQRVVELNVGSYSCRSMNGQPGAPRSEHSYGNAVDVMAFRLSDGRQISVERGWRGAPEEQDFLREVFVGACRHFTTVLAPGADIFHYNHIHMDLARHAHGRTICKPIIKFMPRLPEDGAAVASGGAAPLAGPQSYGTRGTTLDPSQVPPATSGAGGPPMRIHDRPLPSGTLMEPAGPPDEDEATAGESGQANAGSWRPVPAAPQPQRRAAAPSSIEDLLRPPASVGY